MVQPKKDTPKTDPSVETNRMKILEAFHVLKSSEDPVLDQYTHLAARHFNAPYAFISFMDQDSQWIKSSFGFPLNKEQNSIARPICSMHGKDLCESCPDPKKDPENVECLLTTLFEKPIPFYAGKPLKTQDGVIFGMLCILDEKERPPLSDQESEDLQTFANLAVDLLEQRKTKSSLKKTTKRLQSAFEGMSDGLWEWDHEENSMSYTPRLADMLGMDAKEMPQTWQGFTELVHGDDVHSMTDMVQSLLMSDEIYNTLTRFWHKNGEVRYLRCKARTIFDDDKKPVRTIGLFSDESDIHNYQAALEESEKRFRDVVNTSGEYIWELDKDGCFSFLTERVTDVLGYPIEEITGKKFLDFLPDKERRIFEDIIEDHPSLPQPFRNIEHEVIHKSGHLIWQSISGAPMFDSEGFFLGYRGTASNITHRKQQEQALQIAMIEAEKATRTKSQFLATMSHEIRTPMNAVIGMADVMMDTELSEEQQTYMEAIHNSGKHLLHLINDILDFSKLDAGEMVLEHTPFSLTHEIDEVYKICKHGAKTKNLSFEYTIEDDVPVCVMGDAARLRQILLNLLSNAIKFTTSGSVQLRIFVDDKNETSKDSMTVLGFEVTDTGIGIAPDVLPNLFKEFSQADSTTTREYGGTGLGLAICKQLTGLMGGELSVESDFGNGSIFTVRIPYTLPEEESQEFIIPDTSSDTNAQPGKPYRILVAEDSPNNQLLIDTLLSKMGHKITLVEDGIETIEAMKTIPFDLVFMDIQMPNMDGLEAIKLIKTLSPPASEIPVVALTADVMNHKKERLIEMGFADFLAKPIEKRKLIHMIQAWGGKRIPVKAASDIPRKPEDQIKADVSLVDLDLWNDLAESLSGSELTMLIDKYWQELEKDVGTVIQTFKMGDYVTMAQVLHKMKGTASSHSATGLSDHLENMENMIETSKDIFDIQNAITSLLTIIDKTRQEMDYLLKTERHG